MGKKIGVDLGGSWMRVGVLDGDGTLRADKHSSPVGWDQFAAILAAYRGADVEGFGIAIAGPIENHAIVVKGPNLHWLDGRDVRSELQATLGKPVVVSNDMEAATEGERARGVLQHYRWAIFDTISTGWGGNLLLGGRRVDGEPGHTNVRFDTRYRCGCGNFGCNEALYSGSAMQRRIREHLPGLAAGADPWHPLHTAVDAGIPWAVELLDDWAEGVGRAWANVLNRVRPMQAIAYMGTTAESLIALPRVEKRLRETMRVICQFPEHKSEVFPILKAQEEDRSLYGAIAVYDMVCRKAEASAAPNEDN
jgi:predicted NBD/HSP70 family sugar kinase